MKFAFALLPIAAAHGFVQAWPVVNESPVRASILPRNIYRAHYWHVVGQACSPSDHKDRLYFGHTERPLHCIHGNNSCNPNTFQANHEGRKTAMIY